MTDIGEILAVAAGGGVAGGIVSMGSTLLAIHDDRRKRKSKDTREAYLAVLTPAACSRHEVSQLCSYKSQLQKWANSPGLPADQQRVVDDTIEHIGSNLPLIAAARLRLELEIEAKVFVSRSGEFEEHLRSFKDLLGHPIQWSKVEECRDQIVREADDLADMARLHVDRLDRSLSTLWAGIVPGEPVPVSSRPRGVIPLWPRQVRTK